MAQQTNVAGQKTEKQRKAPFRADHVGSLLRSAPVKEARLKKRPARSRRNSFVRSKTRKSAALWKNKKKSDSRW